MFLAGKILPFGRNLHPTICNSETIIADSAALNRVDIILLNGDFERTMDHIGNGYNFFYFDPPYRPLTATSSFNSYAKEEFNDEEQIRLRNFCAMLNDQYNVEGTLRISDEAHNGP